MGDSNRNTKFATFIARNFPKAKTALVVADGHGELARSLANKKIAVTVVEAKPRFVGRIHPLITYKQGWFTEDSEVEADIIVGMHPDEATSEIILAARKNKKPFAIVPCCCVGKGSSGLSRNNFAAWVKRLNDMACGCYTAMLKISGKNLILYKKRWS